MSKKLNQLLYLLKEELGLLFSISLGVFLFVLFFQPFPLHGFDFNNSLLFVAGLGAIVFLFMVLVRLVYPWLIQNYNQNRLESILPSNMGGFMILALNSVAFAFYLHYVGFVSITFYIMFKVALICLAPPVVLWLYDVVKKLKQQNEALVLERKMIQKQIEKYEENYLNKNITFISENSGEKLDLLIADVVFIKSADNYVEIIHKEGDTFKKKLIRNTLKNVEQQIKPYSNFIRCHRICIVNTYYIERLNKNYNNHWLTIKGFDELIPVSRQYLLKLKETL
ncbi:MAG: LytTR family transcriptional regulator DNA-binding domain-containing protein [Lentimicrobiaceae bacterium]|jgi:DNA-binding LytR/AlgR family response regulator|nr:LytTR family transcriptional regulator DNA-binding domain-containing protein [Lentimicrobiaceae bacterium]